MPKTVVADSLTKDGRFFTKHVLEQMNGKTRKKNSGGGKTRKKNSRGRKTRSKRQRGGNQKEKDTYLFDAIDISDYDKVENALNNGANVNARNKDGDTPLIRAIELEDIDMVYLLLEHPDIDIELDVDTNKELQLAEELTPEGEEQNGIPYAIEDYIETKKEKKRIQNIVAQTIPKHLERQKDRKELAARLSKKGVGSFGDGRMPLELRHEIGKYLGGGKRKTRKKNSRGRKLL
jgi:ankyrin repeat protein